MKKLFLAALVLSFFSSCKQETTSKQESSDSEFEYFGEEINASDAVELAEFFENFTEGDSLEMKLKGEINEVCSKKGCWMTMKLPNDEDLMIRFKDYGFFVPLNCQGRTAIIDGWAYKEAYSVEELKHYAFDAGKSEEEINAITEGEVSYTFMAKGVILE